MTSLFISYGLTEPVIYFVLSFRVISNKISLVLPSKVQQNLHLHEDSCFAKEEKDEKEMQSNDLEEE